MASAASAIFLEGIEVGDWLIAQDDGTEVEVLELGSNGCRAKVLGARGNSYWTTLRPAYWKPKAE